MCISLKGKWIIGNNDLCPPLSKITQEVLVDTWIWVLNLEWGMVGVAKLLEPAHHSWGTGKTAKQFRCLNTLSKSDTVVILLILWATQHCLSYFFLLAPIAMNHTTLSNTAPSVEEHIYWTNEGNISRIRINCWSSFKILPHICRTFLQYSKHLT
jgi:hypothetical protein